MVTEADIANIVAQWTGIPIEKVSSDETERLIKVGGAKEGREAAGFVGVAVLTSRSAPLNVV
jgi:hypothetical protein